MTHPGRPEHWPTKVIVNSTPCLRQQLHRVRRPCNRLPIFSLRRNAAGLLPVTQLVIQHQPVVVAQRRQLRAPGMRGTTQPELKTSGGAVASLPAMKFNGCMGVRHPSTNHARCCANFASGGVRLHQTALMQTSNGQASSRGNYSAYNRNVDGGVITPIAGRHASCESDVAIAAACLFNHTFYWVSSYVGEFCAAGITE